MKSVLDEAGTGERKHPTTPSRGGWQRLWLLVPIAAAMIATLFWFQPGRVIAGGDLYPPFVPNRDYWSLWNHFSTGEGSPNYTIVWLPQFELGRILAAVGFEPWMFQRLWFTGLFVGIAGSAMYLARSIGAAIPGTVTAGLVACFNIFWVAQGMNPIPFVTFIVAALAGGVLLRVAADRPTPRPLTVALLSVLSSLVFVNPPHLLILLALLTLAAGLATVSYGREGFRRLARYAARAVPLVVLFNLWWIVPAALTIRSDYFSATFAAQNAGSWEWTHGRASLLNGLTLNTSWGWRHPEYFPFAPSMDRMPFVLFRFALPVLAFLGVMLATGRARARALLLGATALAAVFAAKGTHAPLRSVNEALYDYLPGFWLFREPSKLLLIAVVAYVLLSAIAVDRLALPIRGRSGPVALAALITLAAVAYPRPLVTGEAFPDERPLLPPKHVQVPAYWYDASAFINSLDDEGKLLVLPTPDFYQLPAKWGHYGAPFTRLLVDRPVLEPIPASYYERPPAVATVAQAIETALQGSRPDGAVPLLNALGVRYVLLRRDLDTEFPNRRFADAVSIRDGLRRSKRIKHLRSFGDLDVFELSRGRDVFVATPMGVDLPSDVVARTLTVLPEGVAVYDGGALPGTQEFAAATEVRLFRTEEHRTWQATASSTSSAVTVELRDPLTVRLGDRTLPPIPPQRFAFPRVSVPAAIQIGRRHFFLDEQGEHPLGYVRLSPGEAIRVGAALQPRTIALSRHGPVGDCNAYDDRQDTGIAAKYDPRRGGVLMLTALHHSACVAFDLPRLTADIARLRLSYRTLQGSTARVCVWDPAARRCLPTPPLERDDDWRELDVVIDARARDDLRLVLYADGTPTTTVVEYRGVSITPYRLDPRSSPVLAGPVPVLTSASRVRGEPTVTAPFIEPQAIDLTSFSAVGDCNAYDRRAKEEVGIAARAVGADGIELRARDHSACVSYAIRPFEPAATYRISMLYRTTARSKGARACLWEDSVRRCIARTSMPASRAWERLDLEAPVPEGATRLRLVLYADGDSGRENVVVYRRVTADATSSVELTAAPLRPAEALPTFTSTKIGPARYRFVVREADAPFIIATSESYARGWRLDINRTGVRYAHVRVNGYANGWLVDGEGTFDGTIEYVPERTANTARRVSLAAVLVAVAVMVARRLRRRWVL